MTSRGNFKNKKDKNNSEDDSEVMKVKDPNSGTESFFAIIRKYANEGSNSRQLAIGGLSGWYCILLFVKSKLFKFYFNLLIKLETGLVDMWP